MDGLLGVRRPRMRPTGSSATVTAVPQRRVRQMTTLSGAYVRKSAASAASGRRRQRRAQLSARGDPELREDPVQVRADRAVREKQPLANFAVRQPVRRELGYLQLLRRQLIAGLGHAAPAAFPG